MSDVMEISNKRAGALTLSFRFDVSKEKSHRQSGKHYTNEGNQDYRQKRSCISAVHIKSVLKTVNKLKFYNTLDITARGSEMEQALRFLT
jgi:hypothetical protein